MLATTIATIASLAFFIYVIHDLKKEEKILTKELEECQKRYNELHRSYLELKRTKKTNR